jgi:hypothetical protein
MLREELVAGVNESVELLRLKGVRLTQAFEHDLPDFRESIAFLERSELVRSRLDHRGEIVFFEEESRVALDIYRNSVAHFFVIPSILARAVLAGASTPRGSARRSRSGPTSSTASTSRRASILLSRGEAVLEHFESHGLRRAVRARRPGARRRRGTARSRPGPSRRGASSSPTRRWCGCCSRGWRARRAGCCAADSCARHGSPSRTRGCSVACVGSRSRAT